MDENKQLYTIIMRHDTSTQWAVNNPILTLGEYAVEDDTHRVKRGDGETEWNDLPYEEFGLVYLVNYKNLSGEVSDNPQLVEALDTKMSLAVFEDVRYQAVSSISIEAENGAISKLTKISKNINTATTDTNMLLIKSTDNSIQGYWSVDEEGIRILNLIAESSIADYEVGHIYYRDQLCYYRNRLYRAVETFEAEADFNPIHWVILASKHAEDIAYDNLASELDSDTVQDAITELKRRVDTKVTKTTEHRVVYGTTNAGAQTVIPVDDLRTVDTVNGVPATDQESKNIQIDASDINYDDEAQEPETIKEKLDQKVDKTVAGVGAKIVRDIQFNYNTQTGHITLTEDKVSLEDGSSDEEEIEVDVISEQELATEVQALNDRIDTEVDTINDRIDTEVETLDTKIDEVDTRTNDRITTEVDTLNDRIDDEVSDINDRIDTEVATLNNTITTKETAIYTRIQLEHDEINTRVTNEVSTLNATITALDTKVDSQVDRLDGRVDLAIQDYTAKINNLAQVVADNKADIEGKLTNAQTTINNRIDSEVLTLNTRITTEVDTLNDKIDDEVSTLNTTITTEVATLNSRIDDEVATLDGRIDTEVATLNGRIDTEVEDLTTYIDEQDDLKIDKDIADNLVALLDVATHDSQPTIRITNKNTSTKNTTYDYVHFTTAGLIKTRMEDADHLVIDSTDIDTINTQQNARLTNAEGRLDAHDTSIASLLEHDVNHDRAIATHTSQIANHETRISTAEADIDNLETNLDGEITNRTTADAGLSARIADNAVRIATNTQAIRDNADSIDLLAQTLEDNIEALTNSKVDKDFAEDIGDKIVGKLESDTISNTELINLKKTMISPVNGTTSVERIKIISSDNTVIATRQADGTIDLATNLDTDVNYFVTTDIISTTIGAETTLDMNNLTPTDKTEVEIQDIITDPEGTWGRVKAIDTTNNECTVVTFKRHAQAVWGTIKGTLADQQDLQTVLTNLDDTKVTKTNNANKVYGTDEQGNQTTYDKDSFGKVDTVNNVQADGNKNVTLDGSDINVDDTEANPITIKDTIEMLISDLQNQVVEYTTGTAYTVSGNYVGQNYVTHERYDGVLLMGRVARNFTSDITMQSTYDSFQKDVEDGNIVLVGIPEEDGTTPSHSGDVIVETFNDIEPEGDNSLQVALSFTPAQQAGENPTQYLDFNGSELGENVVATIDNVDGEWDGGEQTISSSEVATFSTRSALRVNRSYVANNFSVSYEESQDDYAEVMDILNEVDGVQDSYDGLGGTEEEVEGILDEILGNTPVVVYPQIGDTLRVTLKDNPINYTGTLPATYLRIADETYDGEAHYSIDVSDNIYSNVKAPVELMGVEGASMLTTYTYEYINGSWNWYVTEADGGTIISGPTIINNPSDITRVIPINDIRFSENMESLYPILLQYFDIEII